MDATILIGVAGGVAAVVLMLRELRLFFEGRGKNGRSRNGKSSCISEESVSRINDIHSEMAKVDLKDMEDKVDQLHTWHAKTDEDGVFIWYVRRSLENAITNLNTHLSTLSDVLGKLVTMQERMEERILAKIDQATKKPES
jgi:hypothetical protein